MTSLFILFELGTGRIRQTLSALDSDVGSAGGVLETAIDTGVAQGLALTYAKFLENRIPDSRVEYVASYTPGSHVNGSGGTLTLGARPLPFVVPGTGVAPVLVPLSSAPSGTVSRIITEDGEVLPDLGTGDDVQLVDPGRYWVKVTQTPWPHQLFSHEVNVT